MVLTGKSKIRSYALRPFNSAAMKLIEVALFASAHNTPFWISITRRLLYIAELLDLLNRPVGKLKTLINPRNSWVFCYLVFSVFFFNRLGRRFVSRQLILASDLDIFELERRCWAENLNIKLELIPAVTTNILSVKNTLKKNILFHLKIFPVHNFFEIFKKQISQNVTLKTYEIYEIGQEVANYLHGRGLFSIAEEVEIFTKITCDKKYGRLAGIRNESSYLTAVGHMSLLGILIMAKKIDFINENEVSILVNESNFSNSFLAEILINKASEVGFRFMSVAESDFMESDLELYPVNLEEYKIARYCYSSIFRKYESKYSQPFLNSEDLDQKIIILAEEILTSFGIEDFTKLVGIHIREDQLLNQANRNSDFGRYLDSLAWLESVGYTVVRLGHSNDQGSVKLGSQSIDTRFLQISRYERDAINLYLWSKALFFIGNLSGGTFPPSLFGVPTLYVDVFPYAHLTLPGVRDLITPKRLFNAKTQQYVDWEDSFERSKTHLQIENPLQLARHGYQLISYSALEMLTCVKKFTDILGKSGQQTTSLLRMHVESPGNRVSEFKNRLNLPN